MKWIRSRIRARQPSADERGFSLVEVLVAAVIAVLAIGATADLLTNLTLKTVQIRESEEAKMIATQVNERARAYQCGLAFGSEAAADLAARGQRCKNGLTASGTGVTGPALGTCASADTSTTAVLGDTDLCWTDGTRQYDVAVRTYWEFRNAAASPPVSSCPVSGWSASPESLVRTITVTLVGSSSPQTLVIRDAAPPNPVLTGTPQNIRSAANAGASSQSSITINGATMTRTAPTGGCAAFPRMSGSVAVPSGWSSW